MKPLTSHRNHETDRYREEEGYQVKCIECGHEFEAKRHDATFCSSTCRGKEFRRRAKREQTRLDAVGAVKRMLKNMPSMGKSPEFDACNEIIVLISRAINNVESR